MKKKISKVESFRYLITALVNSVVKTIFEIWKVNKKDQEKFIKLSTAINDSQILLKKTPVKEWRAYNKLFEKYRMETKVGLLLSLLLYRSYNAKRITELVVVKNT